MRMIRWVVVVAATLAVAGCGGGRESGPADGDDAGFVVEGDSGSPPPTCEPQCGDGDECCRTGAGPLCFPIVEGMSCGEPLRPDAGLDAGPPADAGCDPSFDACGGCGVACDPDLASECSTVGAAPECVCGDFPSCSVPDTCIDHGGSRLCVNLDTSPDHCGAPGNACEPGEVCCGGVCAASCA